MKKLLILGFLLTVVQSAIGQIGMNTNPANTVLLPIQMDGTMKDDHHTGVSFFEYPYTSNNIDVRDMKRRYPGLQLRDTISIRPPDMEFFYEVKVMMGVIEVVNSDLRKEPKLVMFLQGNPNSDKVTFFIDENLDGNFKNDSRPIKITPGSEPRKVAVYPNGKRKGAVDLFLAVPKKVKAKTAGIKPNKKTRYKMDNSLMLGFHAGMGIASVGHEYQSTITGFPGWYNTVLSERNLGISLEKYFYRFKIGLKGSYQNLFQYASYFNLRTGEREIRISPSGTRTVIENLETGSNRDKHSVHRLKVGVDAAYRIRVGRYFDLMPTVAAGQIFFMNNKYLANRLSEPQQSYVHKSDRYMEYGIEMEFTTGHLKAFNLGFSLTDLDWSPDNFFEEIEGTGLSRKYYSYNFIITYKLAMF